VRLEGLGQLKHPMTSLGIEPMTFQLVAQCLNQLHYCPNALQNVKGNGHGIILGIILALPGGAEETM
jgi:hypothetical protein